MDPGWWLVIGLLIALAVFWAFCNFWYNDWRDRRNYRHQIEAGWWPGHHPDYSVPGPWRVQRKYRKKNGNQSTNNMSMARGQQGHVSASGGSEAGSAGAGAWRYG